MKIVRFAAAVAALAAVLMASPASAQEKPGNKMGMKPKPAMTGKMGKTVYVCTPCKMYFTEAEAMKMKKDAATGKYLDPMGHKLVPMKRVPPGFKMAAMAKMHGKMDHKMEGKMQGKMKDKMHGKMGDKTHGKEKTKPGKT